MTEKKKKHITSAFAWLLAAAVIISLMPVMTLTSSAAVNYKDGTYEGTGQGFGGDVTVSLTIQDGKMITLTSPSHTGESYWENKNVDSLLTAILKANSERIAGTDGVDSITGASRSSSGVRTAVNDALSKAVDSGIFASGEGSADKPYLIETVSQMRAFAESVDAGVSYEGEYVALGADIDLSGSDWNPIGTEATVAAKNEESTDSIFKGNFNGQGFTVSGLTMSDSSFTEESNLGLFSTLGSAASVKNLNLTGVKIEIGAADAVLRAGCIAGDTVSGTSEDSAVAALIDSCSAQGSVRVWTDGAKLIFAGGIAGRGNIAAAITNCWTDVAVDAASRGGNNSAYAGGILGTSGNNVKVINCAAFGDVKAVSPKSTNFGGMAGGIAAMYAGKAWNVTASGNVTIGNGGSPHKWIGALFGENTTSGMTNSGGVYVYPDTGAIRDYAYYADHLTLTIEKYVSATGEYENSAATELAPSGTGTLANDMVFSTSENVRAEEDLSGQSFADTMNANLKPVAKLMDAYGIQGLKLLRWEVKDGKVLPTGEAWVNTEPDSMIFESGNGTEADPFIIISKDQMKAFAASLTDGINYKGYFIRLGSDLDISGENWNPVGGSDYAFDGTFDGDGHSICGMTEGSAEKALKIDNKESPYMGLFGVLDEDAVVKNLNLEDVAAYVKADGSFYLGGVAGLMSGRGSGTGSRGARIDNVSVTGILQGTAGQNNLFVGGVTGYLYRGALVNSWTDTDVYAEVLEGSAVAEAGGLVALNNRGLVANCYTLGNAEGKVSREDGAEGAPAVGGLIAVNGGSMANCYSRGDTTGTGLGAVYNGAVTGWITGTGSTYACWYNKDATMTADGKILPEVAAIGTKVPAGVNDEGDAYIGGLADDNNGYTSAGYQEIAGNMNSKFSKFPVNLENFGLEADVLKNWIYDSGKNLVTFGSEPAVVTYVQPSAEIVPEPELIPNDGTWYGRSGDKNSIVEITVADRQVTSVEVLSGENSGSAYDEAYQKAVEKATYGDTSDYSAPDTSVFAGGDGTEASPYLIRTEAQLRYIAEALNEENSWEDVYFLQEADINVGSSQWLPIGWGIRTTVVDREKQYCVYPFEGHYDGGNHTVTDLAIGSESEPTEDIRAQYLSGLFGLISGDCPDNGAVDGRRLAEVKNLNVRNAVINVSSRYQNYVGVLIGFAQSGFVADNCSTTGIVKSSSQDSFARGGGLIGSTMRGLVTDSYADVEITADTDMGHVYAGGFYGMDNRVATINCYALGSVTANAGYTNRIHIGGFIGQAGGVHYNCYAAGNVIAEKDCTDIGGFNGRSAGINVEQDCFWNSDAVQKNNGTDVTEKAGNGADVSSHPNTLYAKSLEELSGNEFANLLNANKGHMSEVNEALTSELVSDSAEGTLTQPYYYEGDGSDLNDWMTKKGSTVVFKEKNEEKPSGGGSGSGGGGTATPSYRVLTPSGTVNGKAEADLSKAKKGDTVTVTVTPEEGYQPDEVVVKDKDGNPVEVRDNGDGTYSFTMPASEVSIETTFKEKSDEPEPTPPDTHENCPSAPFKDVDTSLWYHEGIDYVLANGLMKGVAADQFAPDQTTTRAMIVTILYRLEDEPAAESSTFKDVEPGSWYEAAVNWAASNGIVNGYDADTFAPTDEITREQMSAILYRYAGFKGKDISQTDDLSSFTDAGSVSDWAEDAMTWAVGTGLIKGMSETMLEPQGSTTRAQMATLIMRLN